MPVTSSVVTSVLRGYIPDRGAGRALTLVAFIDSVGTGLYLAGAAIFFVHSIHLTVAQVGLGLSAGGCAGLATTVPIGVLGDRLGPRPLLVLVQLWRATCLVALLFVTNIVSFAVVAALMAIAESATPSLMQAIVAAAIPDGTRVRTMAILRSTRNAGFSVGALVAVPLITVGSPATFAVIVAGDGLSFVVAAAMLARIPVRPVAAAPRRGFLTALGSFRDKRYAALASLNSVLTLHKTILVFGIPLWLLDATRAPPGLVALLLLLNTVMAAVLQVPLSQRATDAPAAARMLRWAAVMLACCSLAAAVVAHASRWPAVAILVLAVVLLSLGEIWQAAGAWDLSYHYLDSEREVQYLAVFSLGVAAQDIFGPALVTAVIIRAGPAGWVSLAACFLAAAFLAGPVASSLERASRLTAPRDTTD